MQQSYSYKLPSFSELTRNLSGDKMVGSYILKQNARAVSWLSEAAPRLYEMQCDDLTSPPQLFLFPSKRDASDIASPDGSRYHPIPSILKQMVSALHLRREVERQILSLEQQLKNIENNPAAEYIKRSVNDAIHEIEVLQKLRCDKGQADNCEDVRMLTSSETSTVSTKTITPANVASLDSNDNDNNVNNNNNHVLKPCHRRYHSSPGRMQDLNPHSNRVKKRKFSECLLDKNLEKANMNPNGHILDICINPQRVVPSEDAIACIEDPLSTSSGGLNNELSVVGEDLVCSHCESGTSPEWRKGPDGKRTLCNACGLFYSKLSKKFGKERAATIMAERKRMGANKDRSLHM